MPIPKIVALPVLLAAVVAGAGMLTAGSATASPAMLEQADVRKPQPQPQPGQKFGYEPPPWAQPAGGYNYNPKSAEFRYPKRGGYVPSPYAHQGAPSPGGGKCYGQSCQAVPKKGYSKYGSK